MTSFQELINKRLNNPKKGLNTIKSTVRDKEGNQFREYVNEKGELVTEALNTKKDILIEAAPDLQVAEIIPNLLYLGSQDATTNFKELDEKNVKFILNVATGIKPADPEKYDYKNIEILDLEETPITKYFEPCFEYIERARKEKKGVLVHCNAGVSRSATIIIAFLMKDKGLPYPDAFKFVKERRPKINPNPGFVEILKGYSPNKN